LSIRQISASTKINVGSIQNNLQLAERHQLTWPLPDDLDDQSLARPCIPDPIAIFDQISTYFQQHTG